MLAGSLEPKRLRLLNRLGVSPHPQPPRAMGRGVPLLFVKRDDPMGTLARLAGLHNLSLLRKGRLVIAFGENQNDRSTWEVAEDAGGPFRELFALMAEHLKQSPLLAETADGSLLPAASADAEQRPVAPLKGLGRLLALSIIRSTPLDVCFSRCLYKVTPSFEHRTLPLPSGAAAIASL